MDTHLPDILGPNPGVSASPVSDHALGWGLLGIKRSIVDLAGQMLAGTDRLGLQARAYASVVDTVFLAALWYPLAFVSRVSAVEEGPIIR